jgi:hypothetical protein
MALGAQIAAVKPVGASSYRGPTDAALVMSDLAKTIGLAFENNGVSVILSNPYFSGTAWEQVKECGQAAGINYSIDKGALAIWPKSSIRKLSGPVKISPETGMVGYPTFSSIGINVVSIFNPDVTVGCAIEISSEIVPARGLWSVYAVSHHLESETPNGQWFTTISCSPVVK